ncbi:MAG: hypothetical protein KDA62_06755, partial [Planctomycetales bacterium]|nr:hypothetical protein [Planctomycetales bacterium]
LNMMRRHTLLRSRTPDATLIPRGIRVRPTSDLLNSFAGNRGTSMSYRCHGAIFRAATESAVEAFEQLADPQLRLDLIHIGHDVHGVRVLGSLANNRIERLDGLAQILSERFHAAFTVWYESIWSAHKFAIFHQGRLFASLRTDGEADNQWLDAKGAIYEFGPPRLLSNDGSFLAQPSVPVLPGRRDARRECDLSVAASILGIESLGGDEEELFRWESLFPAIKRNYS